MAMDKLVPKSSWMRKFSPFVAVAAASAANVYLMRRNETVEGVAVYRSGTNELLGKSPEAGKKAVLLTALTRISTATPIMVMPPLLYMTLKLNDRVKSKVGHTLINMAMVGVGMFVFLPTTLAIFPQTCEVKAGELGGEILAKVGGNPDAKVYFNKGL
jgi:hypothetical protein